MSNETQEEVLIYEQRGNTAWLTMNRPKAMNSINLATIARFERLLPEIAANDDIRVLVLEFGNMAGDDLRPERLGRSHADRATQACVLAGDLAVKPVRSRFDLFSQR
mgnify:CR=1 FL=1